EQTRDPSKEVLEPRRPDLNVPLRLHALTNDSPDQQARTAPVVQVNKLSRATVPTEDDIDPGAFRLAVLYLIHRIYVGGPSLPLEEQVRIVWRVPEPGRGPSASMSQAR
ncbi:hypothetical protein O3W51_01400, partial [Streptomyces sp. H39-C1]|nr:hypothetical protein [Streptomyces sp. H39-C1]